MVDSVTNKAQNNVDDNCFKPTLDNFPYSIWFSEMILSHGLVSLNIIMLVYLFGIIALLIQAYLVSAIKTLADNFHVASVSGRTTIVGCGQLMPQFFCSLIGVFVSKDNLGSSTVIGSCAANSLFSLGVVGLVISGPVKLSWYPLWRDNIFYLVTVTILLWTTHDHQLKWQECLLLISVYILYILIINFNLKVERGVRRIVMKYRTGEEGEDDDDQDVVKLDKKLLVHSRRRSSIKSASYNVNETIPEETCKDLEEDQETCYDLVEDQETCLCKDVEKNEEKSKEFQQNNIQNNAQAKVLHFENSNEGGISLYTEDGYTTGEYYEGESDGEYLSERGYGSFSQNEYFSDQYDGFTSEGEYLSSYRNQDNRLTKFARHARHIAKRMKPKKKQGCFYVTIDMDQYIDGPLSPFIVPSKWYYIILWVLSIPAVCLFHLTIPDCRKPKWRSWYPMTLIISVIWVGVLSYMLVWMSVVIGYTFKIPDSILGFAFLGTGLSFSSIVNIYLQSQAGNGCSAVYNIYGSNVFNIAINLGLVWFIISLIKHPYDLHNGSIVYVNLCQFLIVLTPLLLQFTRWRLTKVLAAIYLVSYCCFAAIVVLLEYDILGDFNPPVCNDI